MLSKKIFMKFGINESDSKEEWGWFVDPELNYYIFDKKNKYTKNVYTTKHVSIPETIKEYEYPSIRSRQSMTNLNNFELNESSSSTKDKKKKKRFSYTKISAKIVTIVVFMSLSYVILIL
jgi:hypothetical protein